MIDVGLALEFDIIGRCCNTGASWRVLRVLILELSGFPCKKNCTNLLYFPFCGIERLKLLLGLAF